MALADDIRPRVKRFLEGKQRREDIARLFDAVRFKGIGRAARDVGDFAAHRDERNQGLTWDHGRAFCASRRLFLMKIADITVTLDDLQNALISRNTLLTDQELKSVGHDRKSAKALIKAICAKLSGHDRTNATFTEPLVGDEKAHFDALMAWNGIPLAFTEKTLAGQLADALVAGGALEPMERPIFMRRSGSIAIFALSLMHRSKLDLTKVFDKESGKAVPGQAHLEITSDSMTPANLAAYLYYKPEFDLRISPVTRIAATDCRIEDWVSADIQSCFLRSTGFDGPLDIDDDGRLAPF